jgi:hypothetical protein
MCFSAGHSFQRLIYYRQRYSGRSIEVLGTLPTEVERSTSRLGYRLEIDQRYDGTLYAFQQRMRQHMSAAN